MNLYTLHTGDTLATLRTMPADSVQCCVTSPPYWGLRDYGVAGQIGLEATIEEHLASLVEVFREVRRVLRPDGTLWLNYGSMYANDGGQGRGGGGARKGRAHQQRNERTGVPGFKPKDLILLDSMVAMALQRDGWWLRSEIIWQKPTAMPESAADRPMRDHEKVYLLSKSERYYYDREATRQPVTGNAHSRGRGVYQKSIRFSANWARGEGAHSSLDVQRIRANPSFSAAVTKTVTSRQLRTVWSIAASRFKGAHFATFPIRLAERCILAGTKSGDTVLDPFSGAASTGVAALRLGRRYVGIDLNPEYNALARERIERDKEKNGRCKSAS